MKNNYFNIILIFVVLSSISLTAQVGKQKRANKEYEKFAFIDSRELYLQLAIKGEENVEVLSKLGDSYYFNNDYSGAYKWYNKLFTAFKSSTDRKYYFRYAQTLKSLGYYNQADTILDEFYILSKENKSFTPALNTDYLKAIAFQKGRFEIAPIALNTKAQDFGANFYGPTQVVFATAVDSGVFFKRRHAWNDKPFLDLYIADRDSYGALSNLQKFDSKINSILHEATPTFSKDLRTMYFTRNNYNGGAIKEDDKNVNRLRIYKSTNSKGKWSKPVAVSFGSDDFSTSHPALSPDGKFLYFSSNMPGSVITDDGELQETDLWRVAIDINGNFGTPENLTINTVGRETYPFISDTNKLYFASNGYPGLGGLDIFVATINSDGSIGNPVNLGEPINSRNDDFAFVIDDGINAGYFSSNRSGGQGDDDIYSFTQLEDLRIMCAQMLTGTVKDAYTNDPINEALVTIKNDKNVILKSITTSPDGNFAYSCACDQQLFVRVDKENYNTVEELVNIPDTSGTTDITIELDSILKRAAVGDDLSKLLKLNPIYFDLDKSTIRPDAAFELSKLLVVLENNPTMVIDIRSHTDSRATAAYNLSLSDRRALSTRQWLISKGISPDRLTARGYGESQLLNKCADGVSCTESEYQLNRRSEFIITSI